MAVTYLSLNIDINHFSVGFHAVNCVKSVRFQNYSGPYFPAFGLNMERYEVSLGMQSECGEI